jgi:hypothetical protein
MFSVFLLIFDNIVRITDPDPGAKLITDSPDTEHCLLDIYLQWLVKS